jgi:hypothetical protein
MNCERSSATFRGGGFKVQSLDALSGTFVVTTVGVAALTADQTTHLRVVEVI